MTEVPIKQANPVGEYVKQASYHTKSREEARDMYFWDYYCWWLKRYKYGRISNVTMTKYNATAKTIWNLIPNARLHDLDKNRQILQHLFDLYGSTHQHATVLDFKNQVLASLRSAVDDNFIDGISDSQLVITSVEDGWSQEKRSKKQNEVKTMDASEFRKFKLQIEIELENGLKEQPIKPKVNPDRFTSNKNRIALSAQTKLMCLMILLHTGCRFAESLGVTFNDIHDGTMVINKTWDYKNETGFAKTKNTSSVRDVCIDETLEKMVLKYKEWKLKYFDVDELQGLPIVVEPHTRYYNDTMNGFFRNRQKKYGITKNLSIHKIRHTYISYLLNEDVSAETIAQQVGHSDTSMIQQVYGHIMAERHEADKLKISSLMR
ncbi:tyrosine-type recombinase/integrase [Paucilactobacillus sp. N302-9]